MPQTRQRRIAVGCALIVVVIALYNYPFLRTRAVVGRSQLPPILASDLTMYLNLSRLTPAGEGRVMNPYYRTEVPRNGAGYLKFGLAASLFGKLDRIIGGRTWLSLLLWNSLWWAALSVIAFWTFHRFLPANNEALAVLGTCVLMFFNFGVAKTIVLAWLHLPSLGAFETIGLPFMRAFTPIIPCVLLLAYLALQIELLRKQRAFLWLGMGLLQLLGLAIFPYATLVMAGITAINILSDPKRLLASWSGPVAYAIGCGLVDLAFLSRGSVGFYDNRSPAIHFQPHVLPQLVGWNWVILVVLTVAVAFTRRLDREVRWPLAGLGVTIALLMLGDAVVPATKILLSHHAGHFIHTAIAMLAIFLAGALLGAQNHEHPTRLRVVFALVGLLVLMNAVLLAVRAYRGYANKNGTVVQLERLQKTLNFTSTDLVIASSRDVDDACGWIPLLSSSPVLFCTDAEVMLTPRQNRDVHRFRQALYLYLAGEDSESLRAKLSAPDPSSLMYRLGYWAEAVSPSIEERRQGAVQARDELVPQLQRVENGDPAIREFLRTFKRIVVIDSQRAHNFVGERLSRFLQVKEQQRPEDLDVTVYAPR